MDKPDLKIDFLDHVAITVTDMEQSVSWYQEVLGLQKVRLEAWGDVPIFMLAGKTGLAIFPAKGNQKQAADILIHHFAFHVDNENFDKARQHYEALGIDYDFQDHHYFHSIYTHDPDGHRVELTTPVQPST